MKKKPTKKAAKKVPARKAAVGKKHAAAPVAPVGKAEKLKPEKLKSKAGKPLPSKPTKVSAPVGKKKPAAKKATAKRKPRKEVPPAKSSVKPGRPSLYSPEMARAICTRLETGESLRLICRDEALPDRSTVARWLTENEEFRDHYARAKEDGIDAILEEAERIADDCSRDLIIGGEMGDKGNSAAVQRAKLRVDWRKWKASKLDPKRWGDKVAVTGDGDKPIPMEITISPESLDAIKIAAAAAATVVAPAAAMSREHLESEDDG